MAWVVVPCLNELRDQINAIAPDRDRASDGSIGDTSHSAGKSSHNPDRTGSPEHADGDAADEVRARDFDVDLRTPGLTMLEVVRHLVTGARQGRFWWLRYIIFQGVIYHRSTSWQARAYTGANSHHHHAHVNSDFTQAADTVRGTNYRLEELVALTAEDKQWILNNVGPAATWDHEEPDPATAGAVRRVGGDMRMMEFRAAQKHAELKALVAAQGQAVQQAIAALAGADHVNEEALAAALAPAVGAFVLANLPPNSDAVSQDEVTTAVKTAFAQAFAPQQS